MMNVQEWSKKKIRFWMITMAVVGIVIGIVVGLIVSTVKQNHVEYQDYIDPGVNYVAKTVVKSAYDFLDDVECDDVQASDRLVSRRDINPRLLTFRKQIDSLDKKNIGK